MMAYNFSLVRVIVCLLCFEIVIMEIQSSRNVYTFATWNMQIHFDSGDKNKLKNKSINKYIVQKFLLHFLLAQFHFFTGPL